MNKRKTLDFLASITRLCEFDYGRNTCNFIVSDLGIRKALLALLRYLISAKREFSKLTLEFYIPGFQPVHLGAALGYAKETLQHLYLKNADIQVMLSMVAKYSCLFQTLKTIVLSCGNVVEDRHFFAVASFVAKFGSAKTQ